MNKQLEITLGELLKEARLRHEHTNIMLIEKSRALDEEYAIAEGSADFILDFIKRKKLVNVTTHSIWAEGEDLYITYVV